MFSKRKKMSKSAYTPIPLPENLKKINPGTKSSAIQTTNQNIPDKINDLLLQIKKSIEPFALASEELEKDDPGHPDDYIYDIIGPQLYRYGDWERMESNVPITFGDFRNIKKIYELIKHYIEF